MLVGSRESRPGDARVDVHASILMEVASRFNVQPVGLPITCMKRMRAYPRDLTLASQLGPCKRGFVSFSRNDVGLSL
jgi:hypothetical protein